MPDEAWMVRRAVEHGVLRAEAEQHEEVLRVGMNEAADLERSFREARVQMLMEMAEWLSDAEAPVAMPCTRGLGEEYISLGPMEMMEVAHILKRASSKSLILLDEIGRGTSTFDGLSIAWSVTEDICSRIHLGVSCQSPAGIRTRENRAT